jgi:hypothetical protein
MTTSMQETSYRLVKSEVRDLTPELAVHSSINVATSLA